MKVEGMNKCLILIEKAKLFELNGNNKDALTCFYEAEKFAIQLHEVEAVTFGIRRLRKKQLRPLKRMLGL